MSRLVVGVGGASGSCYAKRLLEVLGSRDDVAFDLIFSRTGRQVWDHEVGVDPASFGGDVYAHHDMTAPCASGSARYDGMVVVPCSGGGLGRIAHGISADLIGRSADVFLKERRPLVLVLRESPYSLIHCQNMLSVTRAGAVVLPASPSFYSHEGTLVGAIDSVVARILDHLGVDNDLLPRWSGDMRRSTP